MTADAPAATPVDPETIHGRFRQTLADHPDRPLVWFEGETWTYSDVAAAVADRAAFLADRGVERGDRVALLCPNDPEFVCLFLATVRLGATFVPLNHRQEGRVLEHLLDDADPAVLVVEASVAAEVAAVDDALATDEVYRYAPDAVERAAPADDSTLEASAYGAAVDAVGATAPPPAAVPPTDVAVLTYTSGTTGPPKGVRNPHRSYVEAGERLADACRTDPADRALLVLPLFHANPTTYGLMQMLAVGGSVAPVREFSASGFFEAARRSESTFFTHVGSVLEILQRTLDAGDVDPASPLRFAVGGAAQFDRQREFEAATGVQLVRLYGLSELGAGLVTTCRYDPDADHGLSHQGRVDEAPFDVRVLAPDGTGYADEGERGELLVRPDEPGLAFLGYRDRHAATVEAWRDLWMHTGDVGVVEDGTLRYVGREKTSIRVGGENVSPWEVEAAVDDWDAVETAVAVGVDDAVAGEVVGLWVVPADDDLTPAAVHERCRDRLADHLVPTHVGFLDAVPRTSTQKVERVRLSERSFADAWEAER
jgi:crotonobetaine/carnitine-CoA ligase